MLKRRRTEQDGLLVRPDSRPRPEPRQPSRPVHRRSAPSGKRSLAVIALAAAAIYLIAPVLWSANRLRPLAEETLGRALGRTVRIGSLRFTPGFGGLVANDVRVSEDPAFGSSDFASAGQVRFEVERWAMLFDSRLEIASIEVAAPRVTLLRRSPGGWNFHSVLAQGSPISVLGPALRINDGVLIIRAGDGAQPVTLRHVAADFPHFSASAETMFQISGDVDGGGTLKLNGKAGPLLWRDGSAALPMSLLVNARKLALGSSGLAARIAGGLDGDFSLDATIESDGTILSAAGNAEIARLKLARSAEASPDPLPVEFALRHALESDRGQIDRCDLRLGKGSAILTGEYSIADGPPTAELAIAARGVAAAPFGHILAAAAFPLPRAANTDGGVVFLDASLEGALDRPAIRGTVTANNIRLDGFDLAERLAAVSGLDALRISRDTEVAGLSAKFASRPGGGVAVESIELELPEVGRMSGSGAIADGGALDFRMTAWRGSGSVPIPFIVRGASVSPIFRQPGKL